MKIARIGLHENIDFSIGTRRSPSDDIIKCIFLCLVSTYLGSQLLDAGHAGDVATPTAVRFVAAPSLAYKHVVSVPSGSAVRLCQVFLPYAVRDTPSRIPSLHVPWIGLPIHELALESPLD